VGDGGLPSKTHKITFYGDQTMTRTTKTTPKQDKKIHGERKPRKIINWPEYNEALVQRGQFTLWLADDVIEHWLHENKGNKLGRPFTYSNLAIEMLLTIREFFHTTYSQVVKTLIVETKNKIGRFYGDGAYDPWEVRDELEKRGIEQVIPPREDAVLQHRKDGRRKERDAAIRAIGKIGRKGWKTRVGYHRRSLSETGMYRMKTLFGGTLKNRKFENQKTEVRLRCKLLNKLSTLGMPKSVPRE
jgi:hypothetical protein